MSNPYIARHSIDERVWFCSDRVSGEDRDEGEDCVVIFVKEGLCGAWYEVLILVQERDGASGLPCGVCS